MKKVFLYATLLILFLITSFYLNKKQSITVEYEPNIINLKGKIITQKKYGPPNYGENPETDKKVTIYLIDLEHPINVKADPKSEINLDTFSNLTIIQLQSTNSLSKYVGKKIAVSGTLFQGISGHHYTKVIFIINEIKEYGL